MTDKIQEELEKGCGKYIHLGLNPSAKCGEDHFICLTCQAKLTQHKTTRLSDLNEIITFIENERDNGNVVDFEKIKQKGFSAGICISNLLAKLNAEKKELEA